MGLEKSNLPASRTVRRVVGGVILVGIIATGTVGLGLALAGIAHATPEEDCAAVRARDHQIYLTLIASLPPGSPRPAEIVNPCLTAPSTPTTVAPTTTVGLPGVQAPGGGPNVGANAPTDFPDYRGTPVVTIPVTPPSTALQVPADQRSNGHQPPLEDRNSAAMQPDSDAAAKVYSEVNASEVFEPPLAATSRAAQGPPTIAPAAATAAGEGGPGKVGYAALALIGAAGVTAGGAGMRRRRRSGTAANLSSASSPALRGTTLFKATPVSGEAPQYTPTPSTEPMPTTPPGYYYLAQCTPDYPEGAWIMYPEGDNPTPVIVAAGDVTAEQLMEIVPELSQRQAQEYIGPLNKAMRESDINTPQRKAAFIATLAVESDRFQTFEEYASGADYEGRSDLGNTQPGDGVKYKGRGAIQITGRDNYTQMGRDLGVDFVNNPELASTPAYAFETAAWFWTSHDVNVAADQGIEAATLIVNGGDHGLAERTAYYNTALSVLGG